MIRPPRQAPLAHRQQALEARFGLRVAQTLNEPELGHDIEQRLRVARQQALARAAASRQAALPATAVVGRAGATVTLGFGGNWWLRAAALTPLLVLALGVLLIGYVDDEERIRAAVEVDAVLLSDTLPPKAYTDPGFTEYLRQSPP